MEEVEGEKGRIEGREIIGGGGGRGGGEVRERKETGRCERMNKERERRKRIRDMKEKVKEKNFQKWCSL